MDYEKKFDETYSLARDYRRAYIRENVEKECQKVKEKVCSFSISDEDYENSILPYWKKYNVQPDKFWFEYYGSRDNRLDPKFIPGYMYYNDLIPYLNNLDFLRATADKCFFDIKFKKAKMPATICKCIGGLYYDSEMNMVSKDEAIRLCLDHDGKFIIKASVYTCSSRNTFSINPKEYDEKKICELFDSVGANFIVQDRVKQHKELAKFNPGTVNTIRVHSLLTADGVYIPSALLRVGSPEQDVVEMGNGGYLVGISDDNRLSETSYRTDVLVHFDEKGVEKHEYILVPTTDRMEGKYDDNYVIPSMDKIREKIKEIHPMIPHLKFVGWDFTVDEEGNPVLFEFNGSSDAQVYQLICCKPIFGDMTDWVLDDYFIHRTMEKNHKQGLIYI